MINRSMVAVAFTALCLSGCAPLWPTSEPLDYKDTTPNPFPGYTLSEDPTLYGVQIKALKTAAFYRDEKKRIENIKNGGVLALFGVGTWAGVNTVTSGAKGELQALGIAGASIIGLNSVLGVDAQHTAFGAGYDAVMCLIRVDADLNAAKLDRALPEECDTAKAKAKDTANDKDTAEDKDAAKYKYKDAAAKNLAKMRVFSNSITNLRGAASAANFSKRSMTFREDMSINDVFAVNNIEATSDYLTYAKEAANANAELAAALPPKTDAERSSALAEGLDKVIMAVGDTLYNSAKLSDIYDSMVGAITKAGGVKAAAAVKQSNSANLKVAATGAPLQTLDPSLLADTAEQNSVVCVQSFVALAKSNADVAAKPADTVETCLAMVAKKPADSSNTPKPAADPAKTE